MYGRPLSQRLRKTAEFSKHWHVSCYFLSPERSFSTRGLLIREWKTSSNRDWRGQATTADADCRHRLASLHFGERSRAVDQIRAVLEFDKTTRRYGR